MERRRKSELVYRTFPVHCRDVIEAGSKPYFLGQQIIDLVAIEGLMYGEAFFRTHEEAKQKLETILKKRPDVTWLDVYTFDQNHLREVLHIKPYTAKIRVHRVSSPRPSG